MTPLLRQAVASSFFVGMIFAQPVAKQPLTIDDLFSFTEIRAAELSPDGKAVIVGTSKAEWDKNRFRDDLWLWREGADLRPFAQSGRDHDPQWSPDGKYVAFLSGRELATVSDDGKAAGDEGKSKEVERVWILAVDGGEALPLYEKPLKAHAFAWTRDSRQILFSTEQPKNKGEQDADKRDWKDVNRWRGGERGDVLLSLSLANALPQAAPVLSPAPSGDDPFPPEAKVVARSNYSIGEIVPAPDGQQCVFLTHSISGRLEHPESNEIYLAKLREAAAAPPAARQLTHNQALERELHWSPDGKTLYFGVFGASGSLDGKYQDVQGRLYALSVANDKTERLGAEFDGSWTGFAVASDGHLVAAGQQRTAVQLFESEGQAMRPLSGAAGTYEQVSTAEGSKRLLVRHSSITQPTELFLAEDAAHLQAAKQITSFNKLFTERALPSWKPYRWKADDGQEVEGALLYPPDKFDGKHLRMLTLIHGGPADADGDRFGADWYNWAPLAASKGWLVFRPNYRGSTGYGDKFMTGISPHLVSRPGLDILAGVDALVKDGIADADHLAIGGYSYGGYMTNWLITQTTRFRSAVTGAGAVEHASNWGNDDLTYDDAWYLGGLPWEKPAMYQSEAALFQMNKVKTPVHDVIGADDVRVSASQGYLLERALDALNIPHQFLVFPGEGHGLGKNPWHGYIKVREELKWLEKYDRVTVTENKSTQ